MPASDYLRDARVVVVGGGAIGAPLAYRLAQAGATVTVVERAWPGAGTSGRTFAWINGVDKPPRDYHRLSMRSIRDHEDLADELDGDWVHVTGSLHWAPAADALRTADLERTMRQLLGWGTRVDRLTPAEVARELEPDLRIDPGRLRPFTSSTVRAGSTRWRWPTRRLPRPWAGTVPPWSATRSSASRWPEA